jgi:hypothetical protein
MLRRRAIQRRKCKETQWLNNEENEENNAKVWNRRRRQTEKPYMYVCMYVQWNVSWTAGMLCGREQLLDIWAKRGCKLWDCSHENWNVNFLQCVCSLAVHYVVRDFACLVAGAGPPFLVNVFDQLLPVSGEASHPFRVADFSSIC